VGRPAEGRGPDRRDAGFNGWCCDPPGEGSSCSWTPAGGC
jgi:hypothetical protein